MHVQLENCTLPHVPLWAEAPIVSRPTVQFSKLAQLQVVPQCVLMLGMSPRGAFDTEPGLSRQRCRVQPVLCRLCVFASASDVRFEIVVHEYACP